MPLTTAAPSAESNLASYSGRMCPESEVTAGTHSDIFSPGSWVRTIPLSRVHDLNRDGHLPSGHGKKKPVSTFRSGQVQVLLLDPAGQSHGGPKMPNISVWPNDASVCSLSAVLVRGLIPKKYYLSSTACAGILRRAETRGKTLPMTLLHALQAAAGVLSEPETPADKILLLLASDLLM